MTPFQRALAVVSALVVLVFNGILLNQTSAMRQENATLRRKITPSLDEQFALYEHSIEGQDLTALVSEMRLTDPAFDLFRRSAAKPQLVLYFPDELSCRRSLHREIGILKQYEARHRQTGVDAAIVFAGIAEADFQTLARQYGILEKSILDRQGVFQRHLGPRPGALAIVLDPQSTVVFAHLARASGDEGATSVYRKLEFIVRAFSESQLER